MTGQGLLDRMELVNQELQLQPGEANVTRGLVALNVAQDYFESLCANRGKTLGGTVNVTTSANVETAAVTSTILRVDKVQLLDANGKVKRELTKLDRTGGHVYAVDWPYNLASASTGEPRSYWTDGNSFWFAPTPDATYTIRIYGFVSAADITASGTFAYRDYVAFPLALFATHVMKIGVDDEPKDLTQLAAETFGQVLDNLGNFNRDGAAGLQYTEIHTE